MTLKTKTFKRKAKTQRQKDTEALDKLFSEYIRKRAMQRVGGCERCLTKKKGYKELQNSHFYGRGKHSTRWDETNCAGLCGACHIYVSSHPVIHMEWFKNRLGETEFDLLTYRANHTSKPDMGILTLYFTQKLKEMGEM